MQATIGGTEGLAERRRRILVSTPDAHFRQQLLNFLLSEGYQFVDAAENTLRTVEKLRNEPYDAVVFEAETSGPEGLETARFLRRLNPSVRVILAIESKDEKNWSLATRCEFPILLKDAHASDLLYLLEEAS